MSWQPDMYAVKFRFKKDLEWRYATEGIILTEHESLIHIPSTFLLKTMAEARRVKLIILAQYKDHWDKESQLTEIKISKMNGLNLRREREVLDYLQVK